MRNLIFVLYFIGVYQASAEMNNQDINMCRHFYASSKLRFPVFKIFDSKLYGEVANQEHFITLKEKADKIANGELNYSRSENWMIRHAYLMTEQIRLFKFLAQGNLQNIDQNTVWRFHASYSRIMEAIPYLIKQKRSFAEIHYKQFFKILDDYRAAIAETNIFSKFEGLGFTLVPRANETIKDSLSANDRDKIDLLRLYVATIRIDNSLMADSSIVEKAFYFAVSGFKKSTLLPSFFTELNSFLEHLHEEYTLGRTNVTKVTQLLEDIDTLIKSGDFQKVYKLKKSTSAIHQQIAKFYRLKVQFENAVTYTKKSFLEAVPSEKDSVYKPITNELIADYNKEFEAGMRTPSFLYKTGASIKKLEKQLKENPAFEDPETNVANLNALLARYNLLLNHYPKNFFTGFFSPYRKEEIKQVIESRKSVESIRSLLKDK
mgnify:CR=1 FL=1|tara:strand:+ start:45221 stop:46519 length:1299 start_codon:yes stop_codon:yes gene_type:complete